MADNFGTTDNIYIESDYDNIFLIDPNKVENSLGQPMDRPIHHEDLVMYANLEAKMLPRTKLAVGSALTDAVQTTPIASINFLRPGGKTTLNNNYLNEITGLNTLMVKVLINQVKPMYNNKTKVMIFILNKTQLTVKILVY